MFLQDHTAASLKDTLLDELARRGNVAQFVSFAPDLTQRRVWISGREPNRRFRSPKRAVEQLLAASPEGAVNIRSFEPERPKSREFLYRQTGAEDIHQHLRRLGDEGLYTIVNETIDIHDGGVSGVVCGEVIEFAPDDTPRCVEKPQVASLPRVLGSRMLQGIYGFFPALPERRDLRVEFSLHPLRRGYRRDHTVVWEIEVGGEPPAQARIEWPNRFSRLIGDKAYGLLLAHLIGLDVPRTIVIPRRLAPFSFGRNTGFHETWLRTCPREQVPGRFTTRHGWMDPFKLVRQEDPQDEWLSSMISQQGVLTRYSGGLIAQKDSQPLIEGVAGEGTQFMMGEQPPERLPRMVRETLLGAYRKAASLLGPVRFEWVHDGAAAWIVQMHWGATDSAGSTIFPGETRKEHRFQVEKGLEALRELIEQVKGRGEGIVLEGQVGVTSHFGDLLRRACIPSRIETPREA
ncbi:MAG TPA: hypothetical protein VLV83_09395 [Acidobacteriota bacterium]|nr:hypothetical protein [Acidobacteriota bacterium]